MKVNGSVDYAITITIIRWEDLLFRATSTATRRGAEAAVAMPLPRPWSVDAESACCCDAADGRHHRICHFSHNEMLIWILFLLSEHIKPHVRI